MSHDLVAWLREQIDAEERDALLIPGAGYQPARWTAHRVPGGEWSEIRQHDLPGGAGEGVWEEVSTAGLMVWGRNEDEHVTRWSPSRIVAEVAAKRRLVDLHDFDGAHECLGYTGPTAICMTLRLLALPYADRPGYRADWRP